MSPTPETRSNQVFTYSSSLSQQQSANLPSQGHLGAPQQPVTTSEVTMDTHAPISTISVSGPQVHPQVLSARPSVSIPLPISPSHQEGVNSVSSNTSSVGTTNSSSAAGLSEHGTIQGSGGGSEGSTSLRPSETSVQLTQVNSILT